MSWGTELWDQLDNLEKHTQWGIEFLEKFAKFVKERMEVEETYAKLLRNLVKKYYPKHTKEDEPRFSSYLSFCTVLNELDHYAKQREVMAEKMGEKVYEKLMVLSRELKLDRKHHLQEGRKAMQYLEPFVKHVDVSRRKFEREWKEAEKLQLGLEKLEQDTSTTKSEVDKVKSQLNKRLHMVEESKSEYASQLQLFNEEQRKHYNVSLPNIYESLQDMDELRVMTLGESYRALAEVERRILPVISKCLEGMETAGKSVDIKKDSAVVVDMYKSGLEAPGDCPFEDFTQGVPQTRRPASSNYDVATIKGEDSRRKFEHEWKEAEKLQLGLEKLEQDSSTAKSEVDKVKSQLNKRLHMVEESDSEYASQLQLFNEEQREHYNVSLPNIYESLQDMDELRVMTLGESYQAVAEVERQISPVISKCLEGTETARKSVDIKKGVPQTQRQASFNYNVATIKGEDVRSDAKQRVEKTKRKLWPFGKRPVKNSSSVSLEDYNHLPPEQKQRKLQLRLNDLNRELQKKMDHRDGLMKMKDAYEKNPLQGDATALQPRISETSDTIEQLRSEIFQTENWLQEVTGSQSALGEKNHSSVVSYYLPESSNDYLYEDLGDPLEFDEDKFNNDDTLPDFSLHPTGRVKALYSFDGHDKGFLVIKAGEVLDVIEKDKGNGWTVVRNSRGHNGYVPTLYLKSTNV